MVTLQSLWCWDKHSFLYSTLFLQLIVSELSSAVGVCWSVKSTQVFSTRGQFLSLPQIVHVRSTMFSAWQITRHDNGAKQGSVQPILLYLQRTNCNLIFPLKVTEKILNRQLSTNCQWVESARNIKACPILIQNSELQVQKILIPFQKFIHIHSYNIISDSRCFA